MNKLIKDLTEGERISFQLLLSNFSRGVNASGSGYLSLEFKDCSGVIVGKKWDVNPNDESILEIGNIFKVEADVIKYKDSLQLKVLLISKINESEVDISRFIKPSPIPKEILLDKFNNYIASIKNNDCSALLNYFINKYKDKLFDYPAGVSIHHDYRSGLLTHIISMADIADFLAKQYDVDRDLLVTGTLLHDIGKIIELEGPVIFKYTVEGKLLGHISIMVSEIRKASEELKLTSETALLLEHMVLSHHDKPEYGSPIPPCTKEAMLLSMIDNLDSKMVIADKALEGVNPGEFSSKVFPLEGRCLYKRK